eukprot:TRINITY_DN4140_c0_g1_i1.p1 TRINITY_DN4140_c0_g1~~TRINITY_DN4140_c0_g1_i1.p1  ORF type:complete len:704 (-),score=160.03 TRINITY_DN4140_c0_g1_i1:35-2146(-)
MYFILITLLLNGVISQAPIPNFRPPAVPLINMDPYMNIYSMSDNLYDDWTKYWPGTIKAFVGLVRVDGVAYRWMGPSTEAGGSLPDPIPQKSVTVYPTRTVYTFSNPQINLEVTFTTPMIPNDLDSLRPITYLTMKVTSNDGNSHHVQLYYDNTAEIAVNKVSENVDWQRSNINNTLNVMQIGTQAQQIFGLSGDAVGINWGYFYVASPFSKDSLSTMTQCIGGALEVRNQFINFGTSFPGDDNRKPRPASDDWPVLSIVWNFTVTGTNVVEKYVIMSYDDIFSIQYFGQNFPAYWRKDANNNIDDYPSMMMMSFDATQQLLWDAYNSYDESLSNAEAYDHKLLIKLAQVGGDEYATLGALAFRQVMAGSKLVWNTQLQQSWYFMKEISSDGDLSTVDVIFPASPFFIYTNPTLLAKLLLPILAYGNNETSNSYYNYTNVWAPHHLGYYPIGNILTKDQENMPVEETGNLLLMITAVELLQPTTAFYPHYWPLLKQYAEYLVSVLPDPGDQLCTDDFMGPSPHNANLAAKGIVALAAFSQLCLKYNEPHWAKYYKYISEAFVEKWMIMANDTNHYKLEYDKDNTWSLKYNIAFQKILGLNVFPDREVIDVELDYYLQQQSNRFGVPLDNRAKFTKLDWLSWVSAMSNNATYSQSLIKAIYDFADNTPSRVPLCDWYYTDTAAQAGFQARTVVGGLYIHMCTVH